MRVIERDGGDRLGGRRDYTSRSLRAAAVSLAALLAAGVGGCDRIQALVGAGPAAVSERSLRAAATSPQVKAFYEARQWQAAWSDRDAKALLKALDAAPRHGLDASRFSRLITAAEGDAARDAQLTLAALTYGDALAHGVLNPKTLHDIYELPANKLDVTAGLAGALSSGQVEPWLNGLAPQDAEYVALSKAYLAYLAEAEAARGEPIPTGPEIRTGMVDARTSAIVRRLAVGGYLPGEAPVGADGRFTRDMAQALKSLQRDAHLPPTGRVDEATLRALNDAPADRARQLAVNLERRRWLSRDVPTTRIDVNTAAAELAYLRDGQLAWASRTVVGDPEHQTPALGGGFKQLVVNPPWNVPEGIAAEEILPKGPDYLAAEDMYVDEDGKVVQRPGPKAALGLVKFDMQNRHAIYLHDTPAKAVFASDFRHRSHGCARVQGAVDLARQLASERGKAEAFDAALASGETKVVDLGAEIPVRLLYHTAYLDRAGRLIFADDPYGWDDRVGRALGLEPSRKRPTAAVAHLLGP